MIPAGEIGSPDAPLYEYQCMECGCSWESEHRSRTTPELQARCLHKFCGVRFTHPDVPGVLHFCPRCGKNKTAEITVDAAI